MKRLILLPLMVLLVQVVFAQNELPVSISQKANRSFNAINSATSTLVAEENGNLLFVHRKMPKFAIGINPSMYEGDFMIRWTDKNLNVIAERTLDGTSKSKLLSSQECHLLAASLTDDRVVVVVSDINKDRMVIKRYSMDKASLKILNESELLKYDAKTRNSVFFCLCNTSENGQHTCIHPIVISDNQIDNELVMLNKDLEIEWQHNAPSKVYINQLYTTNSGVAYGLANNNGQRDGKLVVITEDDNTVINYTTDKELGRSQIIAEKDGIVIIAGTTCEEYFNNNNNYTMNGVAGLCIDTHKETLVHQSYSSLDSDDIMALANTTKIKKLYGSVIGPSICASTPTAYGGVVALSRLIISTTHYSNGGTNTTYDLMGLLSFGVNFDGEIIWKLPIYHSESASRPNQLFISLVSDGNRVYVIHRESKSQGELYNLKKPEKVLKSSASGNIAVYTVEETGSVNKAFLTRKYKGLCAPASRTWHDGHFYMLLSSSSKSNLVTLNSINQ